MAITVTIRTKTVISDIFVRSEYITSPQCVFG